MKPQVLFRGADCTVSYSAEHLPPLRSVSYQPGPDDEILWLCERCHVSKGRLDEAVGRVTQEVPENAGLGDRVAVGGQTDLGGVRGHVVGGIEVEVCDVPEPAWTHSGKVKKRSLRQSRTLIYLIHFSAVMQELSLSPEQEDPESPKLKPLLVQCAGVLFLDGRKQ